MMEIYYIQNEKQYRTVISRLFVESEEVDYTREYGIVGCKYEETSNEDGCISCELDECELFNHLKQGDNSDNIILREDILVNFPVILVVPESCRQSDDRFLLVSVAEAKDNTKYGYEWF